MRLSERAPLKAPTVESLAKEMRALRERMENLEDLMELRASVDRNAGKSGVPWNRAKKQLELE